MRKINCIFTYSPILHNIDFSTKDLIDIMLATNNNIVISRLDNNPYLAIHKEFIEKKKKRLI